MSAEIPSMIAIRGAIRVERNDRDAIFRATQRLLREIRRRNDLREEDVLSAFFTMTPDLNADFPAYAAREMGWTDTAMLGAQETAVPGAMDRTVRVLIHARTDGSPRHVYLGEAAAMRPDLAEEGDAEVAVPGARPAAPPPADTSRLGTLLVVGLGLIGGSSALALRRRGPFREVWGHDRDPEARELARRAGAVDAVVGAPDDGERAEGEPPDEGRTAGDRTMRWEDALGRADVVLLALPVDALLAWLERWGARLERGTVVLDVGSTKREVVRAMDRLPEGVEAVGAHPMAGSTESGMGAARPDLFHGAPWALVATGRTGEQAREAAEAVARAVGGRPFWTEAGRHDRAAAATSHLPYVLAAALALHLDGRSFELPVRRLLGPGARDMTRLAASRPEVMAGILATNWPAVREAVEAFHRALEELVGELDAAVEGRVDGQGSEPPALRETLASARRARERVFEDVEEGES